MGRPVIGGSNKMLTTAQAAEYLGLPNAMSLRDNYKQWHIPASKYGGALHFRQRDLDVFIAQREVATS